MSSDEKENNSFEKTVRDVRNALRIKSKSFDEEIKDCINACLKDLSLIGISPSKLKLLGDPLIKKAIYNYSKAEFGLNNTDSEKYRAAYESLKLKMSISSEYTEEVINNVE